MCLGFSGAEQIVTSAHQFHTHFRFPQGHFGTSAAVVARCLSMKKTGRSRLEWVLYEKREWGIGKCRTKILCLYFSLFVPHQNPLQSGRLPMAI